MNSSDRSADGGAGPSSDADIAGIGALADPVRRDLYRYVCAQPEPVGRDAAAAALGIPRHQAKFHLDRLEADGLLVSDYVRLTGRSGPGAGRPAKVYRRGDREIAVSLPQRQYELAGLMMADAIDESMRSTVPVSEALRSTAAARGHAMGEAARASVDVHPLVSADGGDAALATVASVLAGQGYEPRWESGRVIMANCPFHALVRSHTEMVCAMNHALISGVADSVAPGRLRASLDPGENRCCVTLREVAAVDERAGGEASARPYP
ncbi:MAG: helix-turn-helix transcriptional regulator [Intrasporangium sp.]|uniref:helix-turn-helix transcriptional regulator n=1 Tax=Intrasporangium sp. TaxID=1925024 RepID=UPI003F7F07C8